MRGVELEIGSVEPLQAWQNERFAPELLEHKTEVVDCILEQIKVMVRLHLKVNVIMTSFCIIGGKSQPHSKGRLHFWNSPVGGEW